MKVFFDSCTGNVAKFVEKLNVEAYAITSPAAESVTEPFVLVTYTTGFGQVPTTTSAWLEKNGSMMCGVAASGNRNWGDAFAKSAKTISQKYQVPILHTFELFGTNDDVNCMNTAIKGLINNELLLTKQRNYA